MSRNVGDFHVGLGQGHVEPTNERRKYVPRGIKAKNNAHYHREYRKLRKQEAEETARKAEAYEQMQRIVQ